MKRPVCLLALIFIFLILVLNYFDIDIGGYEKVYSSVSESNIAIIIEEKEQKDYKTVYIAKINNKKFILNVKNSLGKLNYGDKISFIGEYTKPSTQRNYGGYDYSLYLKTKKIYGSFDVSNYSILSTNSAEFVDKALYNFKNYVKELFRSSLDTDEAEIAIGLLVGDKTGISDEIEDDFKKANLTHMLAISGTHFAYIILMAGYLGKATGRKRFGQFFTIICVLLFMNLTGYTASVVRAGTMAIMLILASFVHKKPDVWTNMAVAIIIQLVNNPYVIFDVGLQLSYGGVIGIILFNSRVKKLLEKVFKNSYVLQSLSVTISANMAIIPIMMYNFNTLSFSFLISNLLAGSLLGVIIIFGFVLIFLSFIIKIQPLFYLLNLLIKLLIKIAELCGNLPYASIYVVTPSLIGIASYYALVLCKKKKLVPALIICTIFFSFIFPIISSRKINLEINFIDVGQGDSTLIRVSGKNILLDGGGSLYAESFDIGKSTLFPYLLDRGIVSLDYIIVSHFDADHCQGLNFVMENMRVKNVIISSLGQESSEYETFLKLANAQKSNIFYVKMGDTVKIGSATIEILYPDTEEISDNEKNNNAIVCKLSWYNFSVLFTGDIEEKAENKLVGLYENNIEKLQATILKVAHHGSKTSSTQNFLNAVNPKIALIGVGEDNSYGHPSSSVIERLQEMNCKIYRTDLLRRNYN